MINPQHYQELLESAIAPELIEENFYSVEGSTELFFDLFPEPENGYPKTNTGRLTAGLLRLKNRCEATNGLRVDLIDPITGENQGYFQFKPDAGSPLAPKWSASKSKLIGPKYWSPKGVSARAIFLRVTKSIIAKVQERYPQLARFYITPENFWQKIIEDQSIPISITEGQKKTASVLSLGIVAIGLTGVNMGYRNISGFGRVLIPDLKLFAQPGREFNMTFDTDKKPSTQEKVDRAINTTARLFLKEKCEVSVTTVPLFKNCKGAIDDYLYEFGPESFSNLPKRSFTEWGFLNQQQKRITLTPNLRVNTQSMGKAVDASILPKKGILLLDGAKATGKTELLSNICNGDDKAVFSLGHRISLQKGLSERLESDYRTDIETVTYKGVKQAIGKYSNDLTRLSACSEGLPYMRLAIGRFLSSDKLKILVLDEVDQNLISVFTSKTCDRDGIRSVIISYYEDLIKGSDLIVLSSADISMAEINWICTIKDKGNLTKTSIFYIRNEYVQPGYKGTFVNSLEEIIEGSKRAILEDQNIWITTDSKTFSKELNEILSGLITGNDKGLLINSDTSDKQEQEGFIKTIADQNNDEKVAAFLKHYRFVIVTQSLWTSASITVPHFHKVFGCFCSGKSPDWDISQSLVRYRLNVDRIIYCVTRGEIDRDFPFFYENQVKEKLRLSTEINTKILSSLTIPIQPMSDYQWNWNDSPHIKYFCHAIAAKNRSVIALQENLIARLKHEGNTVEFNNSVGQEILNDIKATQKEIKNINKTTKIETFLFDTIRKDYDEIKKIDSSPTKKTEVEVRESNLFHFSSFYKLDDHYDKLENLTCQESTIKLELRKPQTPETQNTLTEQLEVIKQESEIIKNEIRKTHKFDAGGISRAKIKTLEFLIGENGLNGAIAADIKSWNKQAKHGTGIFAPDLTNHTSKVWALTNLLAIKEYLTPDIQWDSGTLTPLLEAVKKIKPDEFHAVFGFRLPEKLEGKTGPLWLFSKLMESLGLKTRRVRKGRKQAGIIAIDNDHYQWLQTLIKKRQVEFDLDLKNNVVMSPVNNQITGDITTSPNDDPAAATEDITTSPNLDFDELKGLILVDFRTGWPDIAVKRTNYTTWMTAQKGYLSRNDLTQKIYRLPTVDDVVRWIKDAISKASPQKAKWLFDNFGGGSDCLMVKAINLFPDELLPIYNIEF
jgi:Domain of unknown function (DUF3854)